MKKNAKPTDIDALVKNMVNWTNPPTVSKLKGDLRAALPHHEISVKKIDEYLREFDLDFNEIRERNKKKKVKNKSEFKSRLIRKQAEWRYPSLSEPYLSTPNIFKVVPKTFDDVERAAQNELVLNHQFNNEFDKVALIDNIVRCLVDEGIVILRTGWLYEEAATSTEVPVYEYVESDDPQDIAKMQRIDQMKSANPEAFESLPEHVLNAYNMSMEQGKIIVPEDTGEVQVVSEKKVINDRPEIVICNYRDTIIDPSCQGDISKAQFVIHEFQTSQSELLKSGIDYKNLDKINFDSHTAGTPEVDGLGDETIESFNFSDTARKQVTAYEYWGYWDIDNIGVAVPIVATFIDDIMIRLEKNTFAHQKLPFDVIKMMPKRRELYGEPDGALIKDNQDTIGAIMRAAIDTMSSAAAGQKGYVANALSPTNKKRFENGEDYEVSPLITDIRSAVLPSTTPELPSSVYNMLTLQNQDAESFTGVKAFANSGLSGDSLGSSVGGIRSALDAAGKRELSILRRITQGLKEVAKKVISLNAQFLDSEYVVRITNEEFVEVDTSNLTGSFDLDIDISTVEADNEKASELAFMLQTLGNNAPFDFVKMILVDIAKLRKMHKLAKELEQYEPQPDPIQQRMAELEVKFKEVEIMDLEASAQERMAQALERRAKAQKALAEAGQVELDTIEQETGTKHVREVDKVQSQAVGNIALEREKNKLTNNSVDNPQGIN